jgi:glycosyltransferase involved in cell wall biosynthesis
MKITAIVCTFNRSVSLQKALDSAAAQVLPESVPWEVLVVDNNSNDQTREVAEQYCRRYPGRFRYIFEPQQGKSHALNRGIREAEGDIVAFMDDDVTAEPAWLQNVTAPLQHSIWVGVGGRIVPPPNFLPPPWLALEGPYELGGILALFDKGREGAELTEAPFGTNMAFRKQIFEKYGLFRPDLGPCPGSEIRGEDTEFGRRVLKGGDRLWYEPSAVVHHAVPENRLQKDYFLRFLYDHGRASIREKEQRPAIWFIPRLYLIIPRIVLGLFLTRILAWLFSLNPQHRFQRKCMVWMNFGQIVEILRLISRGNVSSGNRPPAIVNSKGNSA